jgi:5-methyltetrahydrofolate--homocysteine methyltransferase
MMKNILKDMASRVLVASGAQGTELTKLGFPLGENYGEWVLKHPEALKNICSQYTDCGVDIQSASCTSTNRFRLEHFGLADQAFRMSRDMAALTRKYCSSDCYVSGTISDIGHLLEPLGDVSFHAAYDSYKEQVLGMVEGGVDFVWIGSMADLKTTEAAIKAVKDNSDLVVFASMAFDPTPKGPRTMMGVSPAQAAESLDRAGADAVGVNCGGILMDDVNAALKEMAQVTQKPLLSKPNAGIPKLAEGETVHPVSPQDMADHVPTWISEGARVVSGCCGSGPEHISLIREAVKNTLTIRH